MLLSTFTGFTEVVDCILASGKEFQKRNLSADFDTCKVEYEENGCKHYSTNPKVCINNGKYEMALYTAGFRSPTQDYAKEIIKLINMF